MKSPRFSRPLLHAWSILLVLVSFAAAAEPAAKSLPIPASAPVIQFNRGLPVPAWAFAERAILDAAAAGSQLWVDRYLNADGSLNLIERWGVTDGPDDIT